MNIIVSAFITNINNRNDRNIDKYIEYGKILLNNINCYKVIFIENEQIRITDTIYFECPHCNNTRTMVYTNE